MLCNANFLAGILLYFALRVNIFLIKNVNVNMTSPYLIAYFKPTVKNAYTNNIIIKMQDNKITINPNLYAQSTNTIRTAFVPNGAFNNATAITDINPTIISFCNQHFQKERLTSKPIIYFEKKPFIMLCNLVFDDKQKQILLHCYYAKHAKFNNYYYEINHHDLWYNHFINT